VYPLGPAYIGSYLQRERGYEVDLIDLNVEPDPDRALSNLLRDFAPDAVGVSLRDAFFFDEPQLGNLQRVLDIVKQYGDLPVFGGGAGMSLYAPGFLREAPLLDAVVFGEGETGAASWLCGKPTGVWTRGDDGPRMAMPPQFLPAEQIKRPQIAWPHLDPKRYRYLGVQTKRGCPHNCDFCPEPSLVGRKLRLFDLHEVTAAVDDAVDAGVPEIFFVDTIFDKPVKHSAALLRELAKRDRLKLHMYVHAESLTREYVDLLAAAGAKLIYISVESASPSVSQAIGAPTSVQAVEANKANYERHDQIGVRYSYMVGLPEERLRDLAATFAHMIKVFVRGRLRTLPYFEPFNPTPGSALFSRLYGDAPEAYDVRRYRLYRPGWSFYFIFIRLLGRFADAVGLLWTTSDSRRRKSVENIRTANHPE